MEKFKGGTKELQMAMLKETFESNREVLGRLRADIKRDPSFWALSASLAAAVVYRGYQSQDEAYDSLVVANLVAIMLLLENKGMESILDPDLLEILKGGK